MYDEIRRDKRGEDLSFSFTYHVVEKLPKLAWLADVYPSDDRVEVYCGAKVERRDSFFVTGIWDRDFSSAEFDVSDAFYGTGAKITEKGVLFVTPSHDMERIVLYENDGKISVSNSPAFLMAHTGTKLDRNIHSYESIMCSILKGPDGIEDIPVDGGSFIRQFIVSNILVTRQGIEVSRRPAMEPFEDYEDFYARITGSLKAMRTNMEDPSRTARFGMISMISGGYDSAACSALVRGVGCDRVVSLSGGQYDIDDGSAVAKALGYSDVIKRDKNLYKKAKGCIDALYVSSGELGADLQFSVFGDLFEDNLVFVGSRGSYWNKSFDMTEDFEMKGYYFFEAAVSYAEEALRRGSVYAPLPAFGASVCSSLRRISNSEEMKPWSLGGSYDKPIPRRIVESCGVAREAFGMKKYGGGFSFCYDNMARIKSKMSEEGFESFSKFRREHKGARPGVGRALSRLRYGVQISPVYFNIAMSRLHLPMRMKQKPLTVANPGAPEDLIFWGVDLMKRRYAQAMDGAVS